MATVQPLWGEIVDPRSSLTPGDLPRLHDEDGYIYELFEGVLVRHMTSPGHADICQRLGGELYVYGRNTGFPHRILQNALFDLTPPGASKRVTLAPDVSIMRQASPPSWHVPHDIPLLTVEVAGESQSARELSQKAQAYLQAGVAEVWTINHESRTVQVWDATGTTTITDTGPLTSALLPGFALSVRYLLDG